MAPTTLRGQCCAAPGRPCLAVVHAAAPTRSSGRGGRQQPQQQRRRLPLHPACAATVNDTQPSGYIESLAASDGIPTPTTQQVTDASRDAAAFVAVLRRLAQRGSGCTEAHVVAAWAAQRGSPALRPSTARQQKEALQALMLLEDLTRQQLVALTADQLGFVFRCYVLAGGDFRPLLSALQQAACSWGPGDYSAAGLAELGWALASSSQPPSDACRQLVRTALQEGSGGGTSSGGDSSGGRAQQEPQQQQQQQAASQLQQQPCTDEQQARALVGGDAAPQQVQLQPPYQQQRDWQAWFEGTPASRVVLLLWAAARLGCRPCEACIEAASAALLRGRSFAALSTKSLVTLLWALATLRAGGQQPLLQAVTQQLASRMGAADVGYAAAAAAATAAAGGSSGSHGGTRSWRQGGGGVGGGASSVAGEQQEIKAGSPQRLTNGGTQSHEEQRWLGGEGTRRGRPAGGGRAFGPVTAGPSRAYTAAGIAGGSGLAAAAAAAWQSYCDGGGSSGGSNVWVASVLAPPPPPAQPAEELHIGMLSTAVWACGQLRHSDPALLHLAAGLLQERVEEMSPGDIARVLWGLGQLGFSHAPLLGAIGEHLQQPGVLAAFGVRELAMATYAFAALDYFPGQYCVDLIADACLAVKERFDPRALSHVLWNMSRLGFVDELFYQAFVPVILPSIEQYGPAELADVARVYSRYGLNPQEGGAGSYNYASSSSGEEEEGEGGGGGALFDALAAQTVRRIEGADIQDILRIMTAFHQMGLQPAELLTAVEGWANLRLQKLSPQALSLALWSFARMGSGSPKLLETAAAAAQQQLPAFTPPQLAKVAWSFAKLRWPAPHVLRHAGAQLAAHTPDFGGKEASNVLWALASEGEAPPSEALNAIATNLQPRLKGFGPQSLSNISWAYATLGHAPPPPFLHLLAEAALCQLRAFEPQGLSLLVWSLASLDCRHNTLSREIEALLCDNPGLLRQFEGQHLANLLWGLCRAGHKPTPDFMHQLAQEAELRVCDFKPQELFNIVWAFSQLGHHPGRLFDAVASEVAPRAFAFSPQELTGTLWALAKQGHATPSVLPLAHAVEREVAVRGAAFDDRHLAILAWSFSQLGHTPGPQALGQLLEEVEGRVPRMGGRALATLTAGLAGMEAQQRQRWRWRDEQQQQQPEQKEQQSEQEGWLQREQQQQQQHGGLPPASSEQATAAPPAVAYLQKPQLRQRDRRPDLPAPRQQQQQQEAQLVPPHLVAALAARTHQLLPHLQPFEYAHLLQSFALLGSRQAAFILMRAPDAATAEMLQAAAEHAPLPAAVSLLWAMAQWQCYPRQPFAALCARLRLTRPQYRLSQPALVLLGQAVQRLGRARREQLGLRRGLAAAALAAAQQAEAAAGSPSGLLGGDGNGSDGKGLTDVRGEQQQQQLWEGRWHTGAQPPPFSSSSGGISTVEASCSNDGGQQGVWGDSSYDIDESAGLV